MLLFSVGSILLVAGIALRRRFGTFLDPIVAFPLVWGAVLLITTLAQEFGYGEVYAAPLLLYFMGAFTFVTGGLFGRKMADRLPPARRNIQIERLKFTHIAILSAVVHAVMLPIWWSEITSIVGGYGDVFSLAFQLRSQTVGDRELISALTGNYLAACFIIVPLLALGAMHQKINMLLVGVVCLPWIAANLLTNGRSALLQLTLVLAYLYATTVSTIKWRHTITGILLFISIFVGGVLLVGKGEGDLQSDFGALATAAITNFFDYLLQGPILFSAYFENPSLFTPTWDPLVFPCSLLERLSLCTVEPLHQDFLEFGDHGRSGNVYSIYLSVFPKYGYAGAFTFIFLYGVWASFHHQRFKRSTSLIHGLLAGYLFSAACLSIFSDLFGPSLNFIFKLVALTFVLRVSFSYPGTKSVAVPIETTHTARD